LFDLEAGDELDLVVETARQWAQSELVPSIRDAESARSVAKGLRETWEEVGLGTLELPPMQGGAGLGCVGRVLVNEELAAGDAGQLLALDSSAPIYSAALEIGGEEAVGELLKLTEQGRLRGILVVAEDAARCDVDESTMTLDVPWVAADAADVVAVLTSDSLLVATSGLVFDPVRGAGFRAAGGAGLRVDGAAIVSRWTNAEGAGRAKARVRLHYASVLLGILRATCEFSNAYAQEREAFGKPIGHHQALAFLITDMRMALEAARGLVHEAAWRVDAGLTCSVEAAAAWAECIEIARSIGPNGVQILGGHGFMADYPVEKHMREARALSLLCGGFDAAVEEAGRGLIESSSPLALCSEGGL